MRGDAREGLKRQLRADAGRRKSYNVLFEAVERQGLSASWQVEAAGSFTPLP
jgi:hypothetical protein